MAYHNPLDNPYMKDVSKFMESVPMPSLHMSREELTDLINVFGRTTEVIRKEVNKDYSSRVEAFAKSFMKAEQVAAKYM